MPKLTLAGCGRVHHAALGLADVGRLGAKIVLALVPVGRAVETVCEFGRAAGVAAVGPGDEASDGEPSAITN